MRHRRPVLCFGTGHQLNGGASIRSLHRPSSFTGDGAPGRRLEWSRPITTHGHSHHYHVAALRALFFDSFHQENTSWWFAATIAHPPTGWRASAVKTVRLRTRTDGRSSRGQSCSCGWVTVSSRHHPPPTPGNWELRRRWIGENAPCLRTHCDYPHGSADEQTSA